MQTGPEVLREIAKEAEQKFPDSIDKSMEWARVACKRKFKMTGCHPWVVDLVMGQFRTELHYVRGKANQSIQASLPEPNMRGGEKNSDTDSSIAAAHETPTTLLSSTPAPRQPDRAGISRHSAASIGQYLSQRIAGTTWGQLYGRQIPSLLKNHEAIAGGALKIAFVLKKLSAVVSEDQQVSEVLSDDEMGQLFAEADSKRNTFLGQGVALLG